MKGKMFFIIFKGLSLKLIKTTFMKGESSNLKAATVAGNITAAAYFIFRQCFSYSNNFFLTRTILPMFFALECSFLEVACVYACHISLWCAIIARLIFDNWPFRRAIIALVTVAKSRSFSVFLSLMKN